ncbi:MAG: molybdopterin-dependent oxidoreductase [Anaerolineae bacterium]|nr:molybdopterin-dependent oxidoreductase [Anaerolineae bacterium]
MYGKHPTMTILDRDPFNAAPPLKQLRQSFVTPCEYFYVRNHGSLPMVDPHHYRLTVSGMVNTPLSLSLDQLQQDFSRKTIQVTLQCAGNRRHELADIAPIPGEHIWEATAISTAAWTGVLLRDVLRAAGVNEAGRHVAFSGLDEEEKDGTRFHFGGSIPLGAALRDDVLLAYTMNGDTLPPEHGFPLRVVVPGYIGARSVKWLSNITVQEQPSDNYYQAHAYKLFPPHVCPETADWSKGLMLGELPVNAVICDPAAGETIHAGRVAVRGYATTGGIRQIERVDVSLDNGETWIEADLSSENAPGVWRFWEAYLNLAAGDHQITVRAWDSAANTQPEDVRKIWNFKGYLNNAWHTVRITAR